MAIFGAVVFLTVFRGEKVNSISGDFKGSLPEGTV